MLPLGWSIKCVLLTLCMSACGLEISGYGSNEVICSKGLSDCTMQDELSLTGMDSNAVDVRNLTPHIKLCCKKARRFCSLCLVIDTEIDIYPHEDMEDEDYSGSDEEDNSMKLGDQKVFVTVCYTTAPTMPICKKVEFVVNHTALTHQNQAKLSMVITEPTGVSFSSRVVVYSFEPSHLSREVVVPSLDEVCSEERQQEYVEECHVPRLNSVINQHRNQVELQSADGNKSFPSVCIQYEQSGRCQRWNREPIPLYLVTPCMCLQVWHEGDQWSRRSLNCPFNNSDFSQRNLWQNVSVSAGQGQISNQRSMLWWNVSAPCRLEGEVWPCYKENSCKEVKGFRQQLTRGKWRQNRKGQWEKEGVFEDIDLQFSPCVMLGVKGMGHELGPFCFDNSADRSRWSLLIVCAMLVVSLTVIIFYLLHGCVKKWVWNWHHGGFVEIGRRHHAVLLSPPDMDVGVSESVCRLGSMLCNQGFSVSVDQWSRKEQCILGPMPWLHGQLQDLNNYGGRVVLVLTCKALEKAEDWTHWHKEVIKMKEDEKGLPKTGSPYSDVFMASLCLLQAEKRQGKAGKRFVLVNFDPNPCSGRILPELFQGLLLFQLPSQTQDLLKELTQ